MKGGCSSDHEGTKQDESALRSLCLDEALREMHRRNALYFGTDDDSELIRDVPSFHFSVATWNVWFCEFKRHMRWNALLCEALARRPDFLALQEVTPELARIIEGSVFVAERYEISSVMEGIITSEELEYDVMMLVRKRNGLKIKRWWSLGLPSAMDRRCIGVDVELSINRSGAGAGRATYMRVATVHLESRRKNARIRARQLASITSHLQRMASRDEESAATTAILCGDMNFCSSWCDENSAVRAHYVDSWHHVHGGDKMQSGRLAESECAYCTPPRNAPSCAKYGYTIDTSINMMRLEQKDSEHKAVRFDRILVLKSSDERDPAVRPRTIDLLGTEAITQGGTSGVNGDEINNNDDAKVDDNRRVKRRREENDKPQVRHKGAPVFPSDHFGLVATMSYDAAAF